MTVKQAGLKLGYRRPRAVTEARGRRVDGSTPVARAAEVLHVLAHQGRWIATVRLLGGDVETGTELVIENTTDLWEVKSLGFGQPAAWEAGLRDLELAAIGHHHELRPGQHLIPVAAKVSA